MKAIKSVLLILTIALFYTNSGAQNNLQFNAVKYIQLSASALTSGSVLDSVRINVPTGKVWKIESAAASLTNNSAFLVTDYSNPSCVVTLNGVVISSTASTSRPFPIWLPSGSYLLILFAYGNSSVVETIDGYISAIEFNLVQ